MKNYEKSFLIIICGVTALVSLALGFFVGVLNMEFRFSDRIERSLLGESWCQNVTINNLPQRKCLKVVEIKKKRK